MIWTQLKQPVVRQLAWACFSPPLVLAQPCTDAPTGLVDFAPELTPARLAWLQGLDADPDTLEQWLAGVHTTRLGIRFERLWRFFLDADPEYRVLASNLPVRDGGHTLGEFDLLVEEAVSGQCLHIELAVKYYLEVQAPDAGRRSLWQGPDSRDRLDLKLNHLLTRQLRLSGRHAAQGILDNLGIAQVTPALSVRGWLFCREDGEHQPPPEMNPGTQIHRWCTIEEFLDWNEPEWVLLKRSEWLTASPDLPRPAHATPAVGSETAARLEQTGRPQLLAHRHPNSDRLDTRRRLFVTPRDWPLATR